MKRKLFSAILFGALLTASTSGLTSCKDYDDDISNLQSQIDKLATADQLSAKVSEMQAAISAAQSAAESKAAAAQSVADAAKSAAADAAAAASKAQSTADGATQAAKDAAAAAAAADEVAKAAKAAVDKLAAEGHATKAELEAAAAAAKTYVDSVKEAIEAAHAADKATIEKAIADGLDEVKAEIAKTNEELGKLADRLKVVEDKLAAIEAGEGQEEALAAIQEEVEAIADALEDIIGEYTSMVTEVSLYATAAGNNVGGNFDKALDFIYVAQEKNAVFPAETGVADAQIKFSAENKNVTTTDSLLIRVSPTNAVLNAANISLINSQGKELSEFVEVKEVKPYNEVITTRSTEGNGLWNVVFKVKDGIDREKFTEAVTYNNKNILFAVAVNNTESNDVRRVISAYDVAAKPSTYEPARIDYQVTDRDGTWYSVSDLHNRFYFSDKDDYGVCTVGENADETGKTVKGVAEYRWKNEPQLAGTTSEMEIASKKYDDVRSNHSSNPTKNKIIEVAVGQEINLSVATRYVGKTTEPKYDNTPGEKDGTNDNAGYAIKGFYVTLDKDFALESSPSEWKAWKSYKYTNVGVPGTDTEAKLFYGNKGTISINDEDAFGDVIGFRVYAVNLDGTLVDPDGRAFYVRVSSEKKTAELAVAELEATLNWDKKANTYHFNGMNYYSANVALSDEVAVLAEDVDNKLTKFDIIDNPSSYGNNVIRPIYKTDYVINIKQVDKKWIANVLIKEPTKFIDDETYTAKATLYNANGTSLCDVTVKFKKVLPTEAPALAWNETFDPAKQVFANMNNSGDIYKMNIGTTWNKPQAVELKTLMNSLFVGSGLDANKNVNEWGWYNVTFKNVRVDYDNENKKYVTDDIKLPAKDIEDNPAVASAYQLENLKGMAVDGLEHAVEYSYNFGKISLKKDYASGNNFKTDYCRVPGEALKMTFNSWIDFEQLAWVKDKQPVINWVAGMPNTTKTINLTSFTDGSDAEYETVETGYVVDGTYDMANVAYNRTLTLGDPTSKVKGTELKSLADGQVWYKKHGSKYYRGVYNPAWTKFYFYIQNIDGAGNLLDEWSLLENATVEFEKRAIALDETQPFVQWDDNTRMQIGAKGKAAKKLSDGNYYQIAYVGGAYKFVNNAGRVMSDQSEANVMENGKQVTATTTWKSETVKKQTSAGSEDSYDSIINCWNTVVRKYTSTDGKETIFGLQGAEVKIHTLINGDKPYMKITDVKAGANDPYTATYSNGKITLTQKAGQLNPSITEGTLTVYMEDCFGHSVTRSLTYKINQ